MRLLIDMASDREVDLAVVSLEVVAVVVPAVAVDLLGILILVGINFFSFVTVGSGLAVDCCVAVVLVLLLLLWGVLLLGLGSSSLFFFVILMVVPTTTDLSFFGGRICASPELPAEEFSWTSLSFFVFLSFCTLYLDNIR